MQILVNNTIDLKKGPSQISSQDRGFLLGDGFFTTAVIKQHQLLYAPYHLKRLKFSAKQLKFEGIDWTYLEQKLQQLIESIEQACLRITISRGISQRGYKPSAQTEPTLVFSLYPLDQYENISVSQAFFCKTPISVNPALAGIKHSSKLDHVMAAAEISQKHEEGLMCCQQHVICGTRTNLFVYRQGQWLTPDLKQAGVNGIMRQLVLNYFTSHSIHYMETELTKQTVLSSDELFVCNSLMGICAISQLEQHHYSTQHTQELIAQLRQEYHLP